MKRRTFLKTCSAAAAWLRSSVRAGQSGAADLEKAFLSPPDSAAPKTWWHWMNGNVSREGITLDLEAMRRVGIRGVQLFQVSSGIPKGPVPYGTPENLDLVRHAIREAERLGLELDLHNCPGWSSSGGPWIPPELSMQRLVWTETFLRGGGPVKVTLPQPPAHAGYYRDAMVVAFPSLAGESEPLGDLLGRVTVNGAPIDPGRVTSGTLRRARILRLPERISRLTLSWSSWRRWRCAPSPSSVSRSPTRRAPGRSHPHQHWSWRPPKTGGGSARFATFRWKPAFSTLSTGRTRRQPPRASHPCAPVIFASSRASLVASSTSVFPAPCAYRTGRSRPTSSFPASARSVPKAPRPNPRSASSPALSSLPRAWWI